MGLSVAISFQDDASDWQPAINVLANTLTECADDRGWIDYRIDNSPHDLLTLAPLKDMSGSRMWRLVWLEEGHEQRRVERRMKIMQLGERQFNLRTEG